MGLDVYVYKNVKKTDSDEDYDFTAFVLEPSWEHKIKNLEKNANYIGERTKGNVSYPYSAHYRFRMNLIKMVGRDDLIDNSDGIKWKDVMETPDLPFYELINFADNEGCLDWETNAKLFEEFKKWETKAEEYGREIYYFKEKYKEWLKVFENGKEKNSVVVFM